VVVTIIPARAKRATERIIKVMRTSSRVKPFDAFEDFNVNLHSRVAYGGSKTCTKEKMVFEGKKNRNKCLMILAG
jgi:hypothetical protein